MPNFLGDKEIKVGSSDREQTDFFDIISLVEDVYKRRESRSRNGRLSATSGTGFCSLMSARNATEEVWDNVNACNEHWFKMGNLIEEIYIEGTRLSGHYVGDQIRLSEDTPMTKDLQFGGYLDILTTDNDGNLIIAESKTCGATIPTQPKPIHLNQLKLYMSWYALNGLIFYQSRMVGNIFGQLKANQMYYEYDVQESIQQMTEVFYTRLCIDEKILPRKDVNLRKKDCVSSFCSFVDTCYGEDEYSGVLKEVSIKKQHSIRMKALGMAKKFCNRDNTNERRNDLFEKINKCRAEQKLNILTKESFERMLY
jgi:hypothetical protein